jgi:hypothetical protein
LIEKNISPWEKNNHPRNPLPIKASAEFMVRCDDFHSFIVQGECYEAKLAGRVKVVNEGCQRRG